MKASGLGSYGVLFFSFSGKMRDSGKPPLSLETYAGSVIQGKVPKRQHQRERDRYMCMLFGKGPRKRTGNLCLASGDFPTPSYPHRSVAPGPGTGHPPRSSS